MTLDLALAILTLGCMIFFVQGLADYSRKKTRMRPQFNQADDVRARQEEEMQKLARLIEEVEKDAQTLDEQLDTLKARERELEALLKDIRKDKGD